MIRLRLNVIHLNCNVGLPLYVFMLGIVSRASICLDVSQESIFQILNLEPYNSQDDGSPQ